MNSTIIPTVHHWVKSVFPDATLYISDDPEVEDDMINFEHEGRSFGLQIGRNAEYLCLNEYSPEGEDDFWSKHIGSIETVARPLPTIRNDVRKALASI